MGCACTKSLQDVDRGSVQIRAGQALDIYGGHAGGPAASCQTQYAAGCVFSDLLCLLPAFAASSLLHHDHVLVLT
jgi:hypothetical protein